MGDTMDMAAKFEEVLQTGDFGRVNELVKEWAADDFVQEWPQSGERIRGADSALAIDRNFPGGMPSMTPRRTLAQGDLAISETELTYADGSRYLGVSVMEFRDGLISKETDYFAEPFAPPQWRAQWVERM